jgi:hypothetical protein
VPSIDLHLSGDGAFPELKGLIGTDQVIHLGNDAPAIGIGVLEGGMTSGMPSVCFRLRLPDGRFVLAETSARLFVTAGRAIEAKFPELLR